MRSDPGLWFSLYPVAVPLERGRDSAREEWQVIKNKMRFQSSSSSPVFAWERRKKTVVYKLERERGKMKRGRRVGERDSKKIEYPE